MLVNDQVHIPESRTDWSLLNPFSRLKMHVRNIPFSAVAQSMSHQTSNPHTSKPRFNTQAHTSEQINNILPSFNHVGPPRRPYNFRNFLPVVTVSRHTFAHTITSAKCRDSNTRRDARRIYLPRRRTTRPHGRRQGDMAGALGAVSRLPGDGVFFMRLRRVESKGQSAHSGTADFCRGRCCKND